MKINNADLTTLAKLFETEAPLFIVGGYVRNKILRIKCNDIDLCSSLNLNQVKKLLQNTNYTLIVKNKKLGTATIKTDSSCFEYSMFRKESYQTGGKHNPSFVNQTTSIIEDAARRDFTINCLYCSILGKQTIDFYGGIQDLENKVIKTILTPAEVLCNDGDRILRMVRFAVELGFEIESKTFKTAKKYIANLAALSSKNIYNEFLNILLGSYKYNKKPTPTQQSYGLELLDKLNAFKYMFPNTPFKKLKGISSHLRNFVIKPQQIKLDAFLHDCYNYLKQHKHMTFQQFKNVFINIKGEDYE